MNGRTKLVLHKKFKDVIIILQNFEIFKPITNFRDKVSFSLYFYYFYCINVYVFTITFNFQGKYLVGQHELK